MPSVTFKHLDDLRVDCNAGESIFEIATRIGRPLSSACGAKATCALCQVKILAGANELSPFNANEKKQLGNVYFVTKIRLGCQARLSGDGSVVLEVVKKS